MPATVNFAKAARALADAAIVGDSEAARRHKCNRESIRRWRARMDNDPDLAAKVAELKDRQDAAWASSLTNAIDKHIQFLCKAAESADPLDPEAIAAVTGALKALAEIQVGREMLDVRLAELRGGKAAGARPPAAPASAASASKH